MATEPTAEELAKPVSVQNLKDMYEALPINPATGVDLGVVTLSDATDSDSDAAMGVAATPLAVVKSISKAVYVAGKGIDAYTWAELSAMSADAAANPSLYDYMVGETKNVTITGYGTYAFQLVGVGHNTLSDGTTAGFTFMAEKIITERAMHSSTNVNDGWASLTMRTFLADTLLAAMPSEVTNYIKTTKVSYQVTSSSSLSTCSDKLWLASEREVFGTASFDPAGSQFAYFAAGNSKVKNKGSSAGSWWLRSTSNEYETYDCCYVSNSGTLNNGYAYGWGATSSYGVVPCFCI